AVSFAFMTVLMSGVNMFPMAKGMQIVLGWPLSFSIWVSSLTVAVYVTLGGLRSAIFNEVLQFFLICAGALLIPILGLYEAGGWGNLKLQIAHNFSAQYVHLCSVLSCPWATGPRIFWWCSGFWRQKTFVAQKWLQLSVPDSR